MKNPTERPIPRRRAIRILGGGAACLAAGGLTALAGCSGGDLPRVVRLPLDKVPEGVRIRVTLGEEPVEVLRTASGVTARSLTCTHTGCEVAWIQATGNYLCPCHNTRFAADGKVMFGPARFPLAPVPVRIEGSEVIVGSESVGKSQLEGRGRQPRRQATEDRAIG